ncbi:teichoic acid transport system permease protein [Tessaracoccus bendigoensis DSM 12906]|uniref:Teichoic acid transport system permease protein n=1 Tax=Tessaracoccus bendigoensis DSM 12906 TaxID=1123357 RepID=A0A1M6DI99_9ACTN|nr:ABC transporter permease [Tessaracoccus bendigoensis]SHI72915.1 teichoic acid transport system permease protein [Tessaracoccus bendigoensis DSM 12906]
MKGKTESRSDVHIYTPHKAGLPRMGEYFRDLWRRWDFAMELANTNMRAANTNTVLGQLWLVVNPLLLAAVYFLLVVVLRGSSGGSVDFPQIAGGLFLFFLITGIIQSCATSVTNSGSLVLNMNFPKLLLIVSNTYLAVRRYLPTLLVYLVIHLLWGKPFTVHMLWIPLAILCATMVGMGIGALVATLQVYFRDTAQFLPYIIRIWLYASPVLYTAEQFLDTAIGKHMGPFVQLNPATSVLGIWGDATHAANPSLTYIVIAVGWSLLLTIVGGLVYMSREREFAVRL